MPGALLLRFCAAGLPGGLTVVDPERGPNVCADSGYSQRPGKWMGKSRPRMAEALAQTPHPGPLVLPHRLCTAHY